MRSRKVLAYVLHTDRGRARDDVADDPLALGVATAGHLLLGEAVPEDDVELVPVLADQHEEALRHLAARRENLAHLLEELLEVERRPQSLSDRQQGLVLIVATAKLGEGLGVLENLRGLCADDREKLSIALGEVVRTRAVDVDDADDLLVEHHRNGQFAADVLLDHHVAIVRAHVPHEQRTALLRDPTGDAFADTERALVLDVGAEAS